MTHYVGLATSFVDRGPVFITPKSIWIDCSFPIARSGSTLIHWCGCCWNVCASQTTNDPCVASASPASQLLHRPNKLLFSHIHVQYDLDLNNLILCTLTTIA
jgi:hypothetical protein